MVFLKNYEYGIHITHAA